MRYLHLGPAMVLPSLLAPETDRRSQVALIASPAGEGSEGRLTPWRGVDGGLVGLTMAGSDTHAAGVE
jgi:hypothetical protein